MIRGRGGLLSMSYLSVKAMRGGDSSDLTMRGSASSCSAEGSGDDKARGGGSLSVSRDQVSRISLSSSLTVHPPSHP